jgi:hypothetical protein
MLKMISFHIQTHLNAFLQTLEYYSQSVDVDGFSLLAYRVVRLRGVFLYILLFNKTQRMRLAAVRLGDLGGQTFH